jgi:hypothetical protein
MKKTFKYVILLFAFLFSHVCYSQTHVQSRDVKRIAGKAYLSSRGSLYEIREGVLLAKLKDDKKQLRDGIKAIKTHSFGMIEIAVPDSVLIEDYLTTLEKTGDFDYVEYDTYAKSCLSPNDTYYSDQWGPGHIHADAAWEITTGSPTVKVAVIEQSGFQLDHPDLYYGNDSYSNLSVSEGVDYVSSTDHTPTSNHGTMVAGIIAAKTNNQVGIAGVAGGNGSPGVKIVPYRISSVSHIASAIYDACDKGIRVINMSIDCSVCVFLNTAFTYAYNHGVIVVCASGNDSSSQLSYPAANEYTIAVGSISSGDYRASDSNYGEGLDLVAPGVGIFSTSTSADGYYYSDSGTSFAAPYVSGVVALMLSVNSTLTPDNIKSILRNTAKKIRPTSYTYNYTGWNEEVGYGLLDAFAAVLIANNCSISGPSCICSSSSGVYTVNNLPSSFSVLWDFTDGFGTCTSSMYMSGHTCTIANNQSKSYMGTLTANIYDNNANLLYTLKKENVALYASFYGTCSGGYLPNPELQPNATIFVSKGSGVLLKSPNFVLKNISHSVTTPSFWDYNNSTGELSVSYPYNDTNSPILINVQNNTNYSDCDNSYLFAIMPNNVLHSYALNATIDGNGTCVVSLVDKENSAEVSSMLANYGITVTKKESWMFEVFNATSGRKVFSQEMTERSCSVSTSSWESGLYVIKAVIGNEELSEKLVVK